MYYDKRIKMQSWLTEHCLICGSVNHIFCDVADAHAWECYFCFNKFWLDDLACDQYCITNGIDVDEADKHLQASNTMIKYLLGNYER